MQIINLKINTNKKILALGAELDTTLAYYYQGKIIVSENLGEIANDPVLLEKKINDFLRQNSNIQLDYILTDLHPEYNSVKIGAKLAKKWSIPHIKVQHHIAHIFSVIAEHYLLNQQSTISNQQKISNFQFPISKKYPISNIQYTNNILNTKYQIPNTIIGIACDGTGYGLDDTIWGGEIFKIKNEKLKMKNIERVGHLEFQTLLGGQLAVEEPARMLIAILAKFLDEQKLYSVIKKFYNKKTFKLLYSQLQQNFNCQQTSSYGRILDATNALLFGCNERKFKHQAARMLEEAAVRAEPYNDIKPIIIKSSEKLQIQNHKFQINPKFKIQNSNTKYQIPNIKNYSLFTINYSLLTTPLFEYLIKNIDLDKSRLAATVHQYLAEGLWQITQEIIKNYSLFTIHYSLTFAGGLANNQIFRRYFEQKGALINKKIPSGDPGISVGQIGWFLMN